MNNCNRMVCPFLTELARMLSHTEGVDRTSSNSHVKPPVQYLCSSSRCLKVAQILVQVKSLNLEEGGAFTVSSADEIIADLEKGK